MNEEQQLTYNEIISKYNFNEKPKRWNRIRIKKESWCLMVCQAWILMAKMSEIRWGLEGKLDVSWYAKPEFSTYQMGKIREGLEDGLDVSIYAKPEYTENQMVEIRVGIELGLDVSIYARPEFDGFQMKQIRLSLEKKWKFLFFLDFYWNILYNNYINRNRGKKNNELSRWN